LVLPSYASIGIAAPLLMLCRFGQGVGLGGEWGGAVLLAIENAPPNKRAWYGMFPQLGAPIGLLLSGGTFLILTDTMSSQDFLDYDSFYSEFVIGSSRFLYPIKNRNSLSKFKERTGRSENPFFTLLKFYKTS
jgi:MFS family permease